MKQNGEKKAQGKEKKDNIEEDQKENEQDKEKINEEKSIGNQDNKIHEIMENFGQLLNSGKQKFTKSQKLFFDADQIKIGQR